MSNIFIYESMAISVNGPPPPPLPSPLLLSHYAYLPFWIWVWLAVPMQLVVLFKLLLLLLLNCQMADDAKDASRETFLLWKTRLVPLYIMQTYYTSALSLVRSFHPSSAAGDLSLISPHRPGPPIIKEVSLSRRSGLVRTLPPPLLSPVT